MDGSIFADPKIIGPGAWFKIHTDAIGAITPALKEAFVININATCNNFRCKKCQMHFRKFIDSHPLRAYSNIRDEHGRDIGFFKWSWELHNQVNKFLNKPQPGLDEAYRFYLDSEANACVNCGNEDAEEVHVSPAIPDVLTLYREGQYTAIKPFKPLKQ
jgi:hypothetical protein